MLPAAPRRTPSAMRRYAYRRMHSADQVLTCAASWTPFADALDIALSANGGTLAAKPQLASAALVVDQGKRFKGRLDESRIFALQGIKPLAHRIRHPDLAIRTGRLVVAGQFRRRHHAPPGLLKTGYWTG